MNEIQAAIGLTGIKNIEHTIQLRKKRYQIYTDCLNELKNLVIPALKNDWKYNYSYYPIFFSQGNKMRETVFTDLKKKNIHCRKYWYPLISDNACYSHESYDIPNAQKLSDSVLALPMGNDVCEKSIEFISKIIRKALNE
jgi:dTDP-4-amino-4,6-dideoxygalactose transaminase